VQTQVLGELNGAGRPPQLTEQCEQPRPRGLGERVIGIPGARQVNHVPTQFTQADYEKPGLAWYGFF
jgi:hypothetical protein